MTQKRLCKGLRHCAILGKVVSCSGLCRVVYGSVDHKPESAPDQMIMCPVYEDAWDIVVNGS